VDRKEHQSRSFKSVHCAKGPSIFGSGQNVFLTPYSDIDRQFKLFFLYSDA
jgi:hypothetical protein